MKFGEQLRSISTGGGLARAAYGALIITGDQLLAGDSSYVSTAPPSQEISPLIAR